MNDYYSVLLTLVYEPVINKFYPQLLRVAVKIPYDKINSEFSYYPMEYKDDLYKLLPDFLIENSKIVEIRFIEEIILI